MNICMTPYTFTLHQVVGLLEDTEKISYGCEIMMVSKPIGLLCSSNNKESFWSAGDPGLIPGLGRSSGEGNGSPLQYSCLENLMDRGAWRATVHGITKSWTQLNYYYQGYGCLWKEISVPNIWCQGRVRSYGNTDATLIISVLKKQLKYIELWRLMMMIM